MVEQVYSLDAVFGSLSHPTRRDILRRISSRSLSISDIAKHYTLSFAAVAKHLDVLERAGLIHKTKRGKQQVISLDPSALAAANDFLSSYQKQWDKRLDSLGAYLELSQQQGNKSS